MKNLQPFRSLGLICTLMAAALVSVGASQSSEAGRAAISDAEFWSLVTELSEPSGVFPQQLMSNEDSMQFVIPALTDAIRPGGVYLGVGAEQNFTYLAALQSSLAFIVDIRRDNMLEVLMYKALFERSADRAEFIARLFSRRRPGELTGASSSTALFDAYATATPDAALFDENVRTVLDTLTATHGFPVSEADQATIRRMMDVFRTAGPQALKGYGDGTTTYAQMMTATDMAGREHGFLATEDRFAFVRALHRRNLIVPVVGDFAGGKALPGIARYLRERNAVVSVFYVSNVERYLWEQGDHGRQFYANVAALPLAESGTFIRSVTTDISRRLGIPIPTVPRGGARSCSRFAPTSTPSRPVECRRIATCSEARRTAIRHSISSSRTARAPDVGHVPRGRLKITSAAWGRANVGGSGFLHPRGRQRSVCFVGLLC